MGRSELCVPTYRQLCKMAKMKHADPVFFADYLPTGEEGYTVLEREKWSRAVVRGQHPSGHMNNWDDFIPWRGIAELYTNWRLVEEGDKIVKCEECGRSIFGRVDKKLCSPACRKRASRRSAADVPDTPGLG